MENSELDLYDIFRKAEGDPKVKAVAADMAKELGAGNRYPDILKKLAQFEVALLKFMEANLGASEYGVFADKCWPAFESYFGFVPCYVNSRLAARGIPVACEVDIYGALSEYICTCATELPATILDINNTVPYDMIADGEEGPQGLQADRPVHGLPLRQHAGALHARPGHALPAHHAPADGAREGPRHHPGDARGTHPDRRCHHFPPPVDGRHGPAVLHGRGRGPRRRSRSRSAASASSASRRWAASTATSSSRSASPTTRPWPSTTPGRRCGRPCACSGVEDISFNRPAGMLYPTENPF